MRFGVRRVAHAVSKALRLAGALTVIGCGPTNDETWGVVKGRVLLDGEPLRQGAVSLRPLGGGWHQPSGVIDAEGRYHVFTDRRDGAPVGDYRVLVFAQETSEGSAAHPGMPRSILPDRYQQLERSPLRFTVRPRAIEGDYDLKLTRSP